MLGQILLVSMAPVFTVAGWLDPGEVLRDAGYSYDSASVVQYLREGFPREAAPSGKDQYTAARLPFYRWKLKGSVTADAQFCLDSLRRCIAAYRGHRGEGA